MSDPVTDVEIEDVLSSIRRLVGDEHRTKPKINAVPEPEESPSKPARLVLTPSLLVPVPAPDSHGVQEQINEVDADEQPASESPEPEAVTTEDEIAPFTLEAAPEQADLTSDQESPEQPASDFDLMQVELDSEPAPQPDDVFSLSPESDATLPEFDDAPDQTGHNTAWADPETTLYQAAGAEDQDDVFSTDDSGDTDDTDEYLTAKEGGETGDATTYFAPSDDSDQLGYGATETDEADPFATVLDDVALGEPDAGQDAQVDVPYSTATLSAKIAALEAKIGETQDQWEPDGALGDDYAGTQVDTIAWQDHKPDESPEALNEVPAAPEFASSRVAPDPGVEPENKPEIRPETIPEPETTASETVTDTAPASASPEVQKDDPQDFLSGDDAILDEETLRELVADIVRQELQGALGERITRNVRKLVRREIHRALTSQELD